MLGCFTQGETEEGRLRSYEYANAHSDKIGLWTPQYPCD